MASNTDFLLALENVSVSFDGFKAVNALNLYIDKGELRVIIGPNGAGKTTVLDLICGRTRLSDGSIKFKNQEITLSISPAHWKSKRRTGFPTGTASSSRRLAPLDAVNSIPKR